MGNRSWLYLEHRHSDVGADNEEVSADEIAEANNNFPVLWQLLLAEGAASEAIEHQRVFGNAGTDNLASDAHAALARIRQLGAFVGRHPMLHTLPQIALQFEALALHLAELIDEVPPASAPRLSANLDELSWLGGDDDSQSFIERNRRECNERWAQVQRCIDSGNHPGVDAALGIQRFADWESWAWEFGFGSLSHPYFNGYEAPRDEHFADFKPESDDDEYASERSDYANHLGRELWRFEADGRWGVMRIEDDEDGGSRRTTVVEPVWDDIRSAGERDRRLLWVWKQERCGLLLADAQAPRVLLEPQLDEVWSFEDEVATAQVGDHLGLLRSDGSWLLEPSVDEVWHFVEGRVRARVGERIGYVDLQGQWAIAPQFKEAEDFTPFGLAPVLGDGGGWGLVRTSGDWAVPPDFGHLRWRHDWESFEATRDGKAGLLDAQGRVVVEPGYAQVELLEEYPAEHLATDDDDDPANQRGAPTPRSKRFVVERTDGLCGLIDGQGWLIVPFDYGRFEALEPLVAQERAHAMARRDLVRVASKGGRTAKNAPWLRGIYDVAAGRELVVCRHSTLQPLAWGTKDIGWLVADPAPCGAKVERGQLAVGVLRADGTVLHPQAYAWVASALSVSDSWLAAAVRSELSKCWSAGQPVQAARNDTGLYVWLHADGREEAHARHMAARHAAGDLRAAYELACHLRDGKGIEADPREAARWMARAAGVREPSDAPAAASPDGLPVAMYELSKMLRWGTAGLGADAALARAWLLHAVANGGADDTTTQAVLGYMLCEGEGGERDMERGVRHYELAAEGNNTMALYNLGLAYKLGELGEPDLARAIQYFRRGHEAGDASATLQLGRTLCRRAESLAEQGCADAEANVLYAEALYVLQTLAQDDARRQQGWACHELGRLRFRGRGAPQDAAAAERWLLTGAALDSCEEKLESQRACMETLAQSLYGDPKSPLFEADKAREWTQRLLALPATRPGGPA